MCVCVTFVIDADAILNDRLVHLATKMAIRLCGFLSVNIALEVVKYSFQEQFKDADYDNLDFSILVRVVIIALLGFLLCIWVAFEFVAVALQPLSSGVTTIFICYSEVRSFSL